MVTTFVVTLRNIIKSFTLINMSVTYNRTMSIYYDITDSPLDNRTMKHKFVADLRKAGIAVNSRYAYNSDLKKEKYGFTESMKGSNNYATMVNGNEVFSSWNEKTVMKLTNNLIGALENAEIEMQQTDSQKKVKSWAGIHGKYCYFDVSEKLDGTQIWNEDTVIGRHLQYGSIQNGDYVTMKVEFEFNYGEMKVKFDINWDAKTVQKKADIEAMVVDVPLKDMGHIQKVIERIASYKKNGVNVDNPTIECHFDAKTESRSECAPDIIAKVREARKTA
jgi:hypothetical protein